MLVLIDSFVKTFGVFEQEKALQVSEPHLRFECKVFSVKGLGGGAAFCGGREKMKIMRKAGRRREQCDSVKDFYGGLQGFILGESPIWPFIVFQGHTPRSDLTEINLGPGRERKYLT